MMFMIESGKLFLSSISAFRKFSTEFDSVYDFGSNKLRINKETFVKNKYCEVKMPHKIRVLQGMSNLNLIKYGYILYESE